DWLPAPNPKEDYGYRAFVSTVDAILWGRKTYAQALSFGPFPDPSHAGKKHYVFTHKKKIKSSPSVEFVSSSPVSFVRRLKKQKGGPLWLMGGAHLIAPLHQAGLIDQYVITIIPVFLGSGIPLFLPGKTEQKLQLVAHEIFENGLVQLAYEKKSFGKNGQKAWRAALSSDLQASRFDSDLDALG
ncbi:MAG: dihydrofolate reductase, partial [Candidatus Micrarchaeota archaeon]|nr:dihydrofolate reductase [Candidatus Micrarchaeota archaeon]